MSAQNSSEESKNSALHEQAEIKVENPHQDTTTARQEIEEKLKGEFYKAAFHHWIIQDFCKQYDINFKIVGDQHEFDGLIYCPIDLPIHASTFLENLSRWIANVYGKNCTNFHPFKVNNSALSDSMIEQRTLMLFQVKRKVTHQEHLLSTFEKTKKKLEVFLLKHQQSYIKRVLFFIVHLSQVKSNEKVEVLPSFVNSIPFEFGGILYIPLWLYFGNFADSESISVKSLIASLFLNIRSTLISLEDFQLQASELKQEREEMERQREEMKQGKEEANQEKEEMWRKRDCEISMLRLDVQKLFQRSDTLKKEIECLQPQSNTPVDSSHHQKTDNFASQTQENSVFTLHCNQLQTTLLQSHPSSSKTLFARPDPGTSNSK